MKTCKELIDFLDDFVEDALPETERRTFEQHLGACPECVEYLDSYERTVEMCRGAYAEETCDDLPEDLVQAILAARTGTPSVGET